MGAWAAVWVCASWCLGASVASAAPWQVALRGPAGEPIAQGVVAVEVRGAGRRTTNAQAQIVQKDRQFIPSVLVVQTGTAVFFPNEDTVRHHVYSFSPIKPFDLKLYTGVPAEPVRFEQAGVAALGCNIHDRMSAHVVVVDTPHFALTDSQGHASLDLPPGEHVLRVWHAGFGQRWWTQPLTVPTDPGPRTTLALPARP